jgi:hypothetical protein
MSMRAQPTRHTIRYGGSITSSNLQMLKLEHDSTRVWKSRDLLRTAREAVHNPKRISW